MKKICAAVLAVSLAAGALAGCSSGNASGGDSADKKIVVGASPSPHAEILEQATSILEEGGYTLEIVEYNDYVQPNVALDAGDLDAN